MADGVGQGHEGVPAEEVQPAAGALEPVKTGGDYTGEGDAIRYKQLLLL